MPEPSAYVRKTYLEWYPSATQLFHVGFGESDELIKAATHLDEDGAAPTVTFQELLVERPETWGAQTTGDPPTISQITVVDDVDEDGAVVMVDGAVQFRVAKGATAPNAGDIYSFLVVADRADDPTLEVATRVWVRVMP